MVVDGVRTTKKQCVRMHLLQCRFFNERTLSERELAGISAREMYRRNKAQFQRQPKGHQRAFVQYIRTPRSTWRSRMRYRWQRFTRKLRGIRGRK